jgi:SAM-dependent methyltransferase
MTDHLDDHLPKHRFDAAKAANLLDPKRRLIDDPLSLLHEMGVHAGMRVADLGCGVGFFTQALLQAVGATGEIIAVELQETMLAMLRERFPAQSNLIIHPADLLHTALPAASCDAVLIAFTMHEVPVLAALHEMQRLLRRNGLLIVLDWGEIAHCPEREPGRQAGPPEEERLLPGKLRQLLLAQGWQITAQGQRLQGCHYWLNARPTSGG